MKKIKFGDDHMGKSFSEFAHGSHYNPRRREPDWPTLVRPRTARAHFDGISNAAGFKDHIFRVRTDLAPVVQRSS